MIESSVHGRERREQRDIDKIDLEYCVKYGKREPGHRDPKTGAPRWKYTFAEVTFVTDETSTKEVTSWTAELPPLPVKVIDTRSQQQYEEMKRRLAMQPRLTTSHCVVIVDMSGSMKRSDMYGHKSRSRGVYYSLAEDFVAKTLNSSSDNPISLTDVVTLIEMRSMPSVVVEKEPWSWQLYNRLVHLSENHKAHDHGNYYNSLSLALSYLLKSSQLSEKCALSMVFFTDGKPSDSAMQDALFPTNLMEEMQHYTQIFGSRFTFVANGFGRKATEFTLLENLVSIVKGHGAREAVFTRGSVDTSTFQTALSSAVSSLSKTRTLLSRLDFGGMSIMKMQEKVDAEKGTFKVSDTLDESWTICERNVKRYTLEWREKVGDAGKKKSGSSGSEKRYDLEKVFKEFLNPTASGFAVSPSYFGEGAERIVYKMTELSHGLPVGLPLVAKSSKFKEGDVKGEEFHRVFIASSIQAGKMAAKFNDKLDRLGVDRLIPRIEFLPCAVYTGLDQRGNRRIYLAEKQLDVTIYKKWNTNDGRLDGIAIDNPEDLVIRAVGHEKLDAIDEEEEEEEEEFSDDEFVPSVPTTAAAASATGSRILDEDIPQAFSHFTYKVSKRKMLICDIQGVLNSSGKYPVFELTDPCCHTHPYKRNYGKTNRGKKGMVEFFKTHQCNAACKVLGIADKVILPSLSSLSLSCHASDFMCLWSLP
jgi:hypothetical protein